MEFPNECVEASHSVDRTSTPDNKLLGLNLQKRQVEDQEDRDQECDEQEYDEQEDDDSEDHDQEYNDHEAEEILSPEAWQELQHRMHNLIPELVEMIFEFTFAPSSADPFFNLERKCKLPVETRVSSEGRALFAYRCNSTKIFVYPNLWRNPWQGFLPIDKRISAIRTICIEGFPGPGLQYLKKLSLDADAADGTPGPVCHGNSNVIPSNGISLRLTPGPSANLHMHAVLMDSSNRLDIAVSVQGTWPFQNTVDHSDAIDIHHPDLSWARFEVWWKLMLKDLEASTQMLLG